MIKLSLYALIQYEPEFQISNNHHLSMAVGNRNVVC